MVTLGFEEIFNRKSSKMAENYDQTPGELSIYTKQIAKKLPPSTKNG
jgi:hypothetical protein